MRWIQRDEDFRKQYAESRTTQAEILASEIIEIADDGKNDTYTDEDGRKLTDYDVIARSRLRVDARKWIASKLLPKVYGEKQGDVHVNTNVNNIVVLPEERLRELQAIKQRLTA